MAGFYEGVSNPGSVTGSTPVHESVASSIGAALGGAAKLLDVGLKADHEDRMNKLDVEIGDKLSGVTNAMIQPNDQPSVFTDTERQPWEGAHGFDKIDNLAQAHSHSPDKVNFSTLMGRASAITQEIIHAHPRYADEIRGRVQKILGINPNEELIKQTLDDEQALKRAKLDIKVRGAQEAQAAGYPMTTLPDGTPDWDSGYKAFAVHQKAVADAEALARDDTHQKEQLEIAKLKNPPGRPETEDERKLRVQPTIMNITDGPFNHIMDTHVNSLMQVMDDLGHLDMDAALPGSQYIANQINTLREQSIAGLAAANVEVHRVVNNLRESTMAAGRNGNPGKVFDAKPADWDEVLNTYGKQFEVLHNLFVTAPNEVIESRIKGLTGLQATLKMNFLEANHTVALLQAFLGENNPGLASMLSDALIRDPDTNLMVFKAMSNAIKGATTPDGKGAYTPTIPPQQSPIGLAHRTIGNIVGTVTGEIATIPDRWTAQVLEGQMNYFSTKAGNLSPNEQMRYGQVADAVVRTGLSYYDVDQVGSAVMTSSSPGQLRTFDAYAKAHPDQAKGLGEKMSALGRQFMQRAINSGTFNPVGASRGEYTYTPMYNPSSGRIELRVTDNDGKVLSQDLKLGSTLPSSSIFTALAPPKTLQMRIATANQAMAAAAHLKEYGENASWQDLQIKQGMAAGLPLRPGSQAVELPTEKQNKAAPKKEAAPVKEAAHNKEPAVKKSPVLYTSEDGYEISGTP